MIWPEAHQNALTGDQTGILTATSTTLNDPIVIIRLIRSNNIGHARGRIEALVPHRQCYNSTYCVRLELAHPRRAF